MDEKEMNALLDAMMATWRLSWNCMGDAFAPSDHRDQAWEQLTLGQARARQLTRPVRA